MAPPRGHAYVWKSLPVGPFITAEALHALVIDHMTFQSRQGM
ncbi:MAG: hypothetical protein NWR45_04520 [Candidatus Nanopelagicales bacterium]|nr:hypothetical protein [Candidatus Nanopelagicales bacterium]